MTPQISGHRTIEQMPRTSDAIALPGVGGEGW